MWGIGSEREFSQQALVGESGEMIEYVHGGGRRLVEMSIEIDDGESKI